MNRDWLGLADDLTLDGVVGAPYPTPAPVSTPVPAAYPTPPRRGRFKTPFAFAALAAIVLCLGLLTPPGQNVWHRVKTDRVASEPPQRPVPAAVPTAVPGVPVKPATPSVASNARTPSPVVVAKPATHKRASAAARPETPRVGDAATAEPARETPAGTGVDLDTYRNLTRGL